MRFHLRINFKYVLVLFLFFGGVLFFVMNNQVTRLVNQSVIEKLDSDNKLGYSLLNQKYPGDWRIEGEKLYKGLVLINDNFELVDEVERQTNSLATIFMGDTRVSTTVRKVDGNRATGTKAAPEVVVKVLKNGEVFFGKAMVAGTNCLTKYIPIRDQSGKVIGMWFVGEKISEVIDKIRNLNILIGLFAVFTVMIGIIISFYLNISVVRPILSTIENLNKTTQQTSSAANQLSAYSQQLSEGNSKQASAVEEASTTLEEAAAMVLQNTENTKQAALLSKQAKETADQGYLEMQAMTGAMSELQKSSEQIAKIMKVIDEIAFQTNILALNAAIEAARAGEAGLGFAVVAEEVRNLAGRCAQAAKDTAAIIESNIGLSEKGVKFAERVRTAFSEITLQAKNVQDLMAEIAAASQEHYQGITQINTAMTQVEQIIQQNAANAEESASASEELSVQADNLKEIVLRLVQMVKG